MYCVKGTVLSTKDTNCNLENAARPLKMSIQPWPLWLSWLWSVIS